MVLPQVLQAKLLKRGIISAQQKPTKEKPAINFKGVEGCPNKYNIYHDCNIFCNTQWKGVIVPDPVYIRRKTQMLKKYPLPPKWKEIFDKGSGRYYYWDKNTNLVSWLPPKHPKTKIGEPAAKLREKRHERKAEEEKQAVIYEEQEKKRKTSKHGKDRDRDRGERNSSKRYSDDRNSSSRSSSKRSRNRDQDPIDPMDPAAYSDIPRGTWADGLDTRGDAKTGADVTASGPLFQQRPYPSVGAVLAANAAANSKNKGSSKEK